MENETKISLNTVAILDRLTDNSTINEKAIQICKNLSEIEDNKIDEKIIAAWETLKYKPKVIAFDLDCTLWPFWIDTHVKAPFKKTTDSNENISITDNQGRFITYYKQVPRILNTLRNHCLKSDGFLAIASRTKMYDESISLFELLHWRQYFDSLQMYSGCKVQHLNKISSELHIKNKYDILFFDDDYRNIYDTKSLGITTYEINPLFGITSEDIIQGLEHHNQKLSCLLSLSDSGEEEMDIKN